MIFRFQLPLFWKFAIAIIAIVVAFGTINLYLIWRGIYGPLEREFQHRGEFVAQNIAHQSIGPVLYEEYSSLQKMVDHAMAVDTTIAYIFVLNGSNDVLAHSFEKAVPEGLISVHRSTAGRSSAVRMIASKERPDELIKDIAVAIEDPRIGTVRVGLYEKPIRAQVIAIVQVFLFMVMFFLALGLAGAFAFAKTITKPIRTIVAVSSQMNFLEDTQTLSVRARIREKLFGRIPMMFRAEDELDLLTRQFNTMIDRLSIAHVNILQARQQMIQSEKLAAIGTLAAGIAHEVNNPLAGLKNCVRRMNSNPANADQNIKYLALMKIAVERIELVVSGLLQFVRTQPTEKVTVNMATVVENALMLVGHRLETSRITVDKQLATSELDFRGSRNQIEQVLVNLLLNAVDAIDERAVSEPNCNKKIVLRMDRRDGQIILAVQDNGMGMTQETADKIFDPFFTTKSSGRGTGLGLSVSQTIVREHGGELTVESEPGTGTIITLRLPGGD
jgi:two-component system NtrC family sensor kinase